MPIVEINGRKLAASHAFGESRECALSDCPNRFVVTNITGRQFYCSDRCKERAHWSRVKLDPVTVNSNRERCRAWAAEHRAVKRRNTWLTGAPPYAEHLPGGAFALRVTPTPHWPIELRNTRALHGLATALIGLPHQPQSPGFALIPSDMASVGWGLYVSDADVALRLAGRQHRGELFNRDVLVTCGPMYRIKSPRVTKRGHRRLRVDCITPVNIRSHREPGSEVTRLHVTGANICSTLATWLPMRLGIQLAPDALRLMLVERVTQPVSVFMGGKYGLSKGFVGHLLVETNAVGEWLLRCAETIGLGGKTAFGFGRIRITHVD